ncbi:MAG: hypothetical protein AAFY45_35215 [Bacteroidota bacterium]
MEEYISYFKALVEYDDKAEPWSQFWEKNEKILSELLSRGSYLRMKSYPLKEIYKILSDLGLEYPTPKNYQHWKFHRPEEIPNSWLTKKITKVKALELLSHDLYSESVKAILHNLKAKDEFWQFSSPPNTWGSLMGRSGIALVREGVPYDHISIMWN